jgi:hypothetical protein
MHRFAILLISLLALTLTACPPAPTAPPAEVTASSTAAGATGAGGDAGPADPVDAATADAAATSAEASTTTSAATGAPAPACEGPTKAPTYCDYDNECWNGNQCDVDVCDLGAPPNPPAPDGRKGTCRWTLLPDNSPCDVSGPSDTHDACRAGACCPGAAEPPAVPVANVLPEAR